MTADLHSQIIWIANRPTGTSALPVTTYHLSESGAALRAGEHGDVTRVIAHGTRELGFLDDVHVVTYIKDTTPDVGYYIDAATAAQAVATVTGGAGSVEDIEVYNDHSPATESVSLTRVTIGV